MIDYNRIIQDYLNPSNTPQTRDAISNKIEPFPTELLRGKVNRLLYEGFTYETNV